MEETAKFKEVRIELPEPLEDCDSLSAVIGFPEWWPTGARIAVVIAHGNGDLNDPLVSALHQELALQRFLTLRFNFPFAEAGKKKPKNPDPAVLEKAFRAALGLLVQDKTSAPSHLFLGGVGLGAQVAARLASGRIQADGLFFLGFPLHAKGKPESAEIQALYRITSSMLFLQGSADPLCELDVLRRSLSRVGAPTVLRIFEGADGSLLQSGQSEAERLGTYRAASRIVGDWMEGILDEV
ncbi:MAG: hypothetical protein NZ990_03620 [Myxococcota bacterium]|nr:hypothetical protein [Myxococcota bacterium]